jgi:hypothetical protein
MIIIMDTNIVTIMSIVMESTNIIMTTIMVRAKIFIMALGQHMRMRRV